MCLHAIIAKNKSSSSIHIIEGQFKAIILYHYAYKSFNNSKNCHK